VLEYINKITSFAPQLVVKGPVGWIKKDHIVIVKSAISPLVNFNGDINTNAAHKAMAK
jgi:hypothetical protein